MTRPLKVLVVEDDDTLRETIGEVMVDDGHEVRLAENGHEALVHIAEWDPEIVVLDLMMPKMNAYEFREAQRRVRSGTQAQILVLSAVPDVQGAATEIGADAWLAKPFRLDELVAVVDDLVDRRADEVGSRGVEPRV